MYTMENANQYVNCSKMLAGRKSPERLSEHEGVIEKDSNHFNLEETPTPFCLSPSQWLQNLALAC